MTPKHNLNTRNGFIAPKLVGLEVLFLSLCYIGQNLGIPQIQDGRHLESKKKAYTENDRIIGFELWEPSSNFPVSFLDFFPCQAYFYNAPELYV